MFNHVFLNVSNLKKSKKFYSENLKTLGVKVQFDDGSYVAYGTKKNHYLFWLHGSEKKDVTQKMHLAFSAKTKKAVDEFYRVALVHGGKSNGLPGKRAEYGPNYYSGYVIDPDGNNIEAVYDKKR
jgi:predicted lactoylglutathione lyase